ncbi:phytanoyl-CoA dioxygenase family protein [Candidatus Pelagibacter ubique]
MLKDNLREKFLNEAINNNDLEYKKNRHIDQNILIKKEQENLEDYINRLINKNISRVTGFIDLKKDSSVKTFLTSRPIISLVQNYLNSQNFSISASFFVSNPIKISNQEKYGNAQFFHWDNDFSKFLKLYIYLTDVDVDSGPHIYIPKSHKKKKLESSLPRLYDDNFIYNSYDQKIEYKGKAGSIFFTDGYGLHKGETPQKNSRIILNVHFGRNKILYSNKDIFYKSNN